ncbi:hypothetical protein E2C01_040417 [Portunus trituberculatus]|uniref:Uncharacterized protein n=1 Tax=Portunus trituberculatus TaxID=210409 RepID=A0A5B7FJN2_PORTR|nr:hypothetical protein [Portunus trituberculatus]
MMAWGREEVEMWGR